MPRYDLTLYVVPDDKKNLLVDGHIENKYTYTAPQTGGCFGCGSIESCRPDLYREYLKALESSKKDNTGKILAIYDYHTCRETLAGSIRRNADKYFGVVWDSDYDDDNDSNDDDEEEEDHHTQNVGVYINPFVASFINEYFNCKVNIEKGILYGKGDDVTVEEISLSLFMLAHTNVRGSDIDAVIKNIASDSWGGHQYLNDAFALYLISIGKKDKVFMGRSGANGCSTSMDSYLREIFNNKILDGVRDLLDFIKKFNIKPENINTNSNYGSLSNWLAFAKGKGIEL